MKGLVWKNIWQTAAAIVALLLLWGIAYIAVGNDLLVPPISDSLKELGALLTKAAFWRGVAFSLLRALAAFCLSFVFALIFAVIAYMVPSFSRFVAPLVAAIRSLPALAAMLILLTVFGAKDAPIAVGFLSLFPMLYTGILAALSGIDRQLVDVARLQGTPLWRRVGRLYLPLSAPYILRESAGALSFSVKLVVSAEVLANTAKSLGGMMQDASFYGDIPRLFALVVVTFLASLVVELSVTAAALAAEKSVR